MTTDAVGGTWTYALELVNALAEHEVEVTLAVLGPAPDEGQRAELAASAVAHAHFGGYALEWMDDPWEDVGLAGEWLLRIADEAQPDLVHLNGYADAALPWARPVVVAGHSDVLSWHEAVRRTPAGPRWSRYRTAVTAGLAAADLLVAPTAAMLRELVRLYEPSCPRLVVHNGSAREFPSRPKTDLVLAAGRVWDEAKNIQALVRVAPRLPWPVAVAGAGDVGAGVQALGRLSRDELDEALAAAAIFVAPARYEPFGLAALEAALAGCALVLGDIPSLREVWGDAAAYVSPADEEELERALQTLIANPKLRADYAHRARRRALRYSPQRMAACYRASYERVLASRAVAAG
jgi:glycogen(starch) synthase